MTIKYSNAPIQNQKYDLSGIFQCNNFPNYDKNFRSLTYRLTEGRVLDIGCGFGSDFMLWLRGRFKGKMINMDVEKSVFDDQYQRFGMQYFLYDDLNIVGNAEKIPLQDKHISLVHQQGLFSDIEDQINPKLIFKEVFRVLTPGGIYIINDSIVPGSENFIKLTGNEVFPHAYRKK